MLVYCLLGQIDYEGSTLLGVYPDLESAEKARYTQYGYDGFQVEVRTLGADAGADYELNIKVIDLY